MGDRDGSAGTGLNKHKALQQFFGWLVAEGEIERSPMSEVPQPKVVQKLVEVLRARFKCGYSGVLKVRRSVRTAGPPRSSRRSMPLIAAQRIMCSDTWGSADRWLIAVGQRLITVSANTTTWVCAAWKTFPSWAVVGAEDKLIPPDTKRSQAERAGAKITEVTGSHVSLVSHPQVVIDTILDAVASVTD